MKLSENAKVALLDLSKAEVDVIESALFAYQIETEGYLQSRAMLGLHDECCLKATAWRARQEQEAASLRERLAAINSVLDRLPQWVD